MMIDIMKILLVWQTTVKQTINPESMVLKALALMNLSTSDPEWLGE